MYKENTLLFIKMEKAVVSMIFTAARATTHGRQEAGQAQYNSAASVGSNFWSMTLSSLF